MHISATLLLSTFAYAGPIQNNEGHECTRLGAFFGQCRKKCKGYRKDPFGRNYCISNQVTGKRTCHCTGWPPGGGMYVCRPGKYYSQYDWFWFTRCRDPKYPLERES